MKTFIQFFNDHYMIYENISNLQKYCSHLILEEQEINNKHENINLDKEKILELIKVYQQNQQTNIGMTAAQKIINTFKKCIYSKIYKFNKHLNYDNIQQLFQSAVLSLMSCLKKIDTSLNINMIMSYILKYIDVRYL